MRQAGEASVEEILDSIKKVIARDNRADAAHERKQRESKGIPLAIADVADDPEEDGVFDLTDHAEYVDERFSEEPPEQDDAPLVTEHARVSMQESLTALSMLAEPGVQPQIVRTGETSLEALTRDLLRPALSEWLETNLPPIVERMVASEIARIVGKRG